MTGASAGIGEAMARQLAAAGTHLVLVARRESKLRELAEELRSAHGVEAEVVAADLARPDAVAELVRSLEERGLSIDLLINNAGIAATGFVAEGDDATHGRMVQVNVAAPTELIARLVPGMLERRRGHVLNVGSMAAFTPIPRMAGYAGSKAYLHAFSEALWFELRRTPVGVTALHPGGTRSEFVDKAGMKLTARYERAMMSSEDVARIGLRAAARRKRWVVPGPLNRLGIALLAFVPTRLVMRIFDRVYADLQGGPAPLS